MQRSNMSHPKMWFFSNIMPNISLLFLVLLSRSAASIYVSSALILVSLIIEVWIVFQDHKVTKMISDLKLD
jgi:hypothetical protein